MCGECVQSGYMELSRASAKHQSIYPFSITIVRCKLHSCDQMCVFFHMPKNWFRRSIDQRHCLFFKIEWKICRGIDTIFMLHFIKLSDWVCRFFFAIVWCNFIFRLTYITYRSRVVQCDCLEQKLYSNRYVTSQLE